MGKLAKVILMIFSALVILIIAAAIIIPLVVDLNDYKPEMEAAVHKQTGRDLKIDGDLDLSVFPWLGVSCGKILLGNAPGFADIPFAVIGGADIKVKLLPLLSKQIEVNTIVLKNLELHLEKNKQGITNWDDLVAAQKTEEKTKPPAEQPESPPGESKLDLKSLTINGLQIKDSQVSWNDQQSGQNVIVKDFNINADSIAFDKPIAIELSMLVENTQPAITEQLNLSTQLTIDEAIQKIQMADFSLDSATKGASIPGGELKTQLTSDIALNLQQQTLMLQKLQLQAYNFNLTAEIKASQLNSDLQYSGVVSIPSFSPKTLLKKLDITAPDTSDPQALQKLSINFDLQGGKDAAALENLKIALDETQINGYTRIKQFKQPAISFKLAVDDIDVDRYSPPKQQKQPTKTPISKTKKAVEEATLLPLETLRKLDLNGDLSIAKLKAAQLKMDGVNLNVQAKQGVLKTKHSIKQLYQGDYQGQITINSQTNNPKISLNEKISQVQLEPLLTDLQPESKAKITGTANIAANIQTSGNTVSAIKSGMNGNMSFNIENGAVRGFNLQKIIDVGKLVTNGKGMRESYSDEQTLFSIIKGTATIKNGLIDNPDFIAESTTTEVKGGGTANLVTEQLDYKVVAKLKEKMGKYANRPVAIKIKGTFSEPSYALDLTSVESMLSEKDKKKVDKFIEKREKDIDKALGEGSGKKVNDLLKSFF